MQLRSLALVYFIRQQALSDWHRYMDLYGMPGPTRKKSKPRWGQPGRHRRRKNRMAARAIEAMRQWK